MKGGEVMNNQQDMTNEIINTFAQSMGTKIAQLEFALTQMEIENRFLKSEVERLTETKESENFAK